MPIKPPFLRTPYNYDTNDASDAAGLHCKEPTRTEQSFKDECDINVLLRRFGIGYAMPESVRIPTYQDVQDVESFHDLMNRAAAARDNFLALPAHIRSEFDNDPAKFHDAAMNEENRAKFEKLGLLDKKPPPPAEKPAPAVAPPPVG